MICTLYARKERTTDKQTLAQIAPLSPTQRDVVIYRDKGATQPVSRYTWWHKKPDRRNRYVMHNCSRYRLEWID